MAEKAVQELEGEIAHQQPQGGAITHVTPAVATAVLNSRVRGRGLSACEIWTQRDQYTSEQMPVSGHMLIIEQHLLRTTKHTHSELSKSSGGTVVPEPPIGVGDLSYIYADRNKYRARNRYLVVSINSVWINIQRFAGNHLRATSYRVKVTECYRVPAEKTPSHRGRTAMSRFKTTCRTLCRRHLDR